MPKSAVSRGARRNRRSAGRAILPNALEGQTEEICRDMAVQVKRMRQLHEQADELRTTFRRWAAPRGAARAPLDGLGTRAIGWAQRLGHARRGRDESAAQLARSQQADAAHAAALSATRWARIVAAIRRQTEAYNTGAGRVVLTIIEQSGEPTVTVAAGGEGTAHLTATLEGTLICMQARDTLGVRHATEFRLHPDRGDDATAAYLLRNWIERL